MERITLTPTNHAEVIAKAIEVLSAGGLVIYPTETCYGIGADATNQEAIDKLLAYKSKRADKPLSIAVADKKMAMRYIQMNHAAKNMYDNFLPGPITVISKGYGNLADHVASSMGTQGVRIPDYPLVLELLKQYDAPITATSANASYQKTPYTIDDVLSSISKKQKDLIDLIIDAGRLPKRKPSTVVDTTLDTVHIVREGALSFEDKKQFLASSLADTTRFVTELWEKLNTSLGKKAIVFLLQGDLGAGKTHFTKALAERLQVQDIVVSPTFIICREYPARIGKKAVKLYHIDAYRLFEPTEIDGLEPEKMFHAPNVTVIEWANKVTGHIDQYLGDATVVKIVITAPSETERLFEYEILSHE